MPIIYGSQDGVREVALTFDDGPHPVHTPRILDELGQRGVKALFFVVGERLESEAGQAIMRRAYAEGHLIGNHTYSHPSLTRLSPDQIRQELGRTEDLIGDCVHELKLFRPPYGATNSVVDRVVREEGYMSVLWNVDTMDWKKRNGAWVDHGFEQIESRENSLVLMHDIHGSTAEGLPELLDRISLLERVEFVSYA